MIYKALIAVIFFFIKDPESVHHLALKFLKILGSTPFSGIASVITRVSDQRLSQTVLGLTFENPVGLAAGFDKEAQVIDGIESLGFGFVEVGTVTRHAQPGNPRQRLFRYPKSAALINRMGFNNKGADAFAARLSKPRRIPRGINFGKSKITELKDATSDYLYTYQSLYEYGDYFVVNVSSPNTPGLRELQDKKYLLDILSALNKFRDQRETRKPLFVKISPDLTNEAIDDVIAVCRAERIDGIVAVNTTTARDGVWEDKDEEGGLSGRPLNVRSTEVIRYIHEKAPQLVIIGVGGIFSAEDAYEKIKAGASLTQIYTGFIYEGPLIVRNINYGLVRLLEKEGYKNISEAVGKGVQ